MNLIDKGRNKPFAPAILMSHTIKLYKCHYEKSSRAPCTFFAEMYFSTEPIYAKMHSYESFCQKYGMKKMKRDTLQKERWNIYAVFC